MSAKAINRDSRRASTEKRARRAISGSVNPTAARPLVVRCTSRTAMNSRTVPHTVPSSGPKKGKIANAAGPDA
jgi:hypothetical protein